MLFGQRVVHISQLVHFAARFAMSTDGVAFSFLSFTATSTAISAAFSGSSMSTPGVPAIRSFATLSAKSLVRSGSPNELLRLVAMTRVPVPATVFMISDLMQTSPITRTSVMPEPSTR
jgi:hypothetical protein